MTTPTPTLHLGHCAACNSHTFPAVAYGCRRCGNPTLDPVPLPQDATLINFVTVNSELAPGLPVPCVIGELELAPGVVEEALIGVPDESGLTLGMKLRPEGSVNDKGVTTWRFIPV